MEFVWCLVSFFKNYVYVNTILRTEWGIYNDIYMGFSVNLVRNLIFCVG